MTCKPPSSLQFPVLALDIIPCLIFSRNILSTKTPSGVPPQHCSCVSSPGSLCIRLFLLRVSRCLLLLYAPSSAAVRPPSSLSAKGVVLGLFHPRRRSLFPKRQSTCLISVCLCVHLYVCVVRIEHVGPVLDAVALLFCRRRDVGSIHRARSWCLFELMRVISNFEPESVSGSLYVH